MDIQVLSPEIIQDTGDDSIPEDLITSTFSSTCIGKPPPHFPHPHPQSLPPPHSIARGPNIADLISAALGSRVLATSDEWFAAASNLLTPTAPVRRAGVYVATGAWYDGWETRRHNPAAFDWAVVKLGVASGRPHGVEIDTAHFDGNHAERVGVQGCFEAGAGADEAVVRDGYTGWREVLGTRDCGPSRRHGWMVGTTTPVTHVRLLMFPDGGIARFRLYGRALPVLPARADAEVELSAAVMGGVAVACSDEHFGTRTNLLLPGRGRDMGDGWETKRSRAPGHHDWALVCLGARGAIRRIVVDTAHFCGNFPQAVMVEAADVAAGAEARQADYVEILALQDLGPDREHEYGEDVLSNIKDQAYTHVKMTIVPDGGVKRFRVFGTVAKEA